MALYPRQNSTFAFDIQLSHSMSVCILICAVRNSTLEFYNATLKFHNVTWLALIPHDAASFVHTSFFLYLFETESVVRHACGSFYASFTIHEWLPWIKNTLYFCGLLITWWHFRKMAHTYEYTYVISGLTCDGLTKCSNKVKRLNLQIAFSSLGTRLW